MYEPSKPYKHDLLKLIQSTWKTKYVTVRDGVYPIITKKFKYPEVQHADGIGTKGVYHWRANTFKNAVIDALAMNLNDMALVGGETSHHNTVDGVDIGLVVSGFIKKSRKNVLKPRDILVGLRSSGLHANGFTKVRALFGPGEWRDEFVEPTTIYLEQVHTILKRHEVHGMMHITGGAFTKLKDVLEGADAYIQAPPAFRPQPIFHELYARGISARDMYQTFNCGIGFVLGLSEGDAERVVQEHKNAAIVGHVRKGTGRVHVVSAFNGAELTY